MSLLREKITRRSLLQSAAGGALLGAWGLSGKTANLCGAAEAVARPAIKITEPFHGAILDHRHGKQSADLLTIRVSGQVNADGPVTVNGMPGRRQGTSFEADVILREPET